MEESCMARFSGTNLDHSIITKQCSKTWLPLWLEKLEKLEYGVIFEKGLEKLEKDIIFKAVELEKLDFHIWVRNIFMKCFTCMFIYL